WIGLGRPGGSDDRPGKVVGLPLPGESAGGPSDDRGAGAVPGGADGGAQVGQAVPDAAAWPGTACDLPLPLAAQTPEGGQMGSRHSAGADHVAEPSRARAAFRFLAVCGQLVLILVVIYLFKIEPSTRVTEQKPFLVLMCLATGGF